MNMMTKMMMMMKMMMKMMMMKMIVMKMMVQCAASIFKQREDMTNNY